MKILILSDDFPPFAQGGAAAVAFNVARGMVHKGHDVSVVTAVRNEKDAITSVIDGIKIYAYKVNYGEKWRGYLSLYNPISSKFIKKIIYETKPDVVHAHNIHNYISYNSLRISKNYGAKVILTAHDCMLFHYGKFTDFIDESDIKKLDNFNYKVSPISQLKTFRKRYNPFRNAIIKFYLRYVDKVCSVSNELKKALEVNGIKNIQVVHNALDADIWKVDRKLVEKYRLENNIIEDKIILFAGKLTKAKGGEQLINALASITSKITNITLIIVGQMDDYTSNLVKQAQSNNIKVISTGWLNEGQLPVVYSSADLVVFPSICFDTFGMVNLEAMISRKPVIATCFGGAKEVVVDNLTGYIINPFDIQTFADNIHRLLSDYSLAKKFGDAGYERVVEKFSIKKQVEEYEAVYR
jgi:glycosyltransferase involved in cell wall biosynthesis